jgi:hypothetical protein
LGAYVVSRFFYAVIVPLGINESDGTQIISGRLKEQNVLEAIKTVEHLHPDAIELHVFKERARAISSV